MKKYINTFWASITCSLEDLRSTNNITHIYGNNLTPRYMGGNPVDRSRLSLSKVIDGQRVYHEGKFEEAFKQLHCLFHDKVFIYILLNDFPHCDLFSTVVQMGMCNRGLDGLYNVGEFVNNHYTFPNIFGYILSQIAFALIDRVIHLEMELSKNPNATIPTRACYYTSEISKKLSRVYIMHVPRFLIFKTMNNIKFLEFKDKKYLINA